MRNKVLYVVICLILCLGVLSSCGGPKEFKFDDAITWDSTFDDVRAKYGTPDEENELYIVYNNFNCCGYDGFTLSFDKYQEDKEIHQIVLRTTEDVIADDTMINDIKTALTEKYGKPEESDKKPLFGIYSSQKADAVFRWDDKIIKNSYITFIYKVNGELMINYIKHVDQSDAKEEKKTNGI